VAFNQDSADEMTADFEVEIQADEPFVSQIEADDLRRAATAALRHTGHAAGALTILITDDETQRALNRAYRAIDAPTDVLSFAAQEETMHAPVTVPPELAAELARNLGDIVIALPYAARQAARYGGSLEAELRLLTVHGVLHLLGYDHGTPEEAAIMWQIQGAVLAAWGDPDASRRSYPA
jgi:probable rRNA maturation factor